ncbi:dienelactone hydrolase family protein [Bradyrhizobium guangxiense]|uniref:dienelactone hydrolase family protein n=1 Tax=Bradyrhizobium guangxiense TaxID=1325115 RepID=UPI001008C661|nr:alpha/beta fold hydrolase [Bradyrhizobium guangxiense]
MRLVVLLLILVTASARAGDGPLMSAHMMLPVVISGNKVSLESFVIRPDRPGKFPLVVITHGMPGGGEEFFTEILNRSPVGYSKAAVAFAQRGYAVVSIMRRGYGRSGGGFSESARQTCDYLPATRAAADDVIAAVASLSHEAWVDAEHVVLLGHSVGGLTVMAVAAQNIPGVVGAVNFDGGRHSFSASNQPCSPDNLVDISAVLGRTARVPMLWLYAENDQFYGPDLAQRMFAAYGAGGAPAELQVLPPFGSNGHNTVMLAPADHWFPSVEPFLERLGLPTKTVIEAPLFAALPIPPGAVAACQGAFADYLANPDDAKAFAVSTRGHCGTGFGRTAVEAREPAVMKCKINSRGEDCRLYAVGQKLSGD